MTLEQLIKIVIESVDDVLNRKAFGFVFDCENHECVGGYLQKYYNPKIITDFNEIPDTLVLDTLPVEYLSKLSMLIIDDEFLNYLNKIILHGGEVIVLKKPPLDNSPEAYNQLINCYIMMLKGFNIRFESYTQSDSDNSYVSQKIYDANVLSKSDLLKYASENKIYTNKSVLVTQLAKEEAEKLKIRIIKI